MLVIPAPEKFGAGIHFPHVRSFTRSGNGPPIKSGVTKPFPFLQTNPLPKSEAPHDCRRCSRLVELRKNLRKKPDWWNAPVPAFGDPDAWLAIVGLAPGKEGANRTGRVFTGDASGDLLFATMAKVGLSDGAFESRADERGQMPAAAKQTHRNGDQQLPRLSGAIIGRATQSEGDISSRQNRP